MTETKKHPADVLKVTLGEKNVYMKHAVHFAGEAVTSPTAVRIMELNKILKLFETKKTSRNIKLGSLLTVLLSDEVIGAWERAGLVPEEVVKWAVEQIPVKPVKVPRDPHAPRAPRTPRDPDMTTLVSLLRWLKAEAAPAEAAAELTRLITDPVKLAKALETLTSAEAKNGRDKHGFILLQAKKVKKVKKELATV